MADPGPTTLFHASQRADIGADIERFLPLSHFGTADAARDRAKSWDDAHIYTVELDFTKVLRVPDFMPSDNRNGLHSWMRLVDQLHYDVRPKVLTSDQRNAVFSAGTPRSEDATVRYNDRAACQALADMLASRWDVIAYENQFEDPGSTSFILLDPSKCRIVSCEPLAPNTRKPRP